MNLNKLRIALLAFILVLLSTVQSFSGADFDIVESDTNVTGLVGFFDLRDRETFMQITNDSSASNSIHIQIFDVSNNCNENDFFDLYTPNDTHVYNLRDIVTNDGNESGVILPDEAYGIFVAFADINSNRTLIGNSRILDDNGYEYRTNLNSRQPTTGGGSYLVRNGTFNFNTKGGVTLSDIIMITTPNSIANRELLFANILSVWSTLDIDIYDLNENAFSCRKVIADRKAHV